MEVVPADGGHGNVEWRPAACLILVHGVAAGAGTTLERWLRHEAEDRLRDRVEVLSPIVGVEVVRVTVRGQRTRWGSASPKSGALSLNWRLVMAPPQVLDYVVIHELAHLRVSGHSARFWKIVERHAPWSRDARSWLRVHHEQLMTALD